MLRPQARRRSDVASKTSRGRERRAQAYTRVRPRSRDAGGTGQVEVKGCAAPRLALDLDVPTALLDDAVRYGQAEATALAEFFRGEERLEDASLHFGRHPTSGIADRQPHGAARRERRMAIRVGAAELDDTRGECQSAPIRHRLASVNRQIQEHLCELVALGSHSPR